MRRAIATAVSEVSLPIFLEPALDLADLVSPFLSAPSRSPPRALFHVPPKRYGIAKVSSLPFRVDMGGGSSASQERQRPLTPLGSVRILEHFPWTVSLEICQTQFRCVLHGCRGKRQTSTRALHILQWRWTAARTHSAARPRRDLLESRGTWDRPPGAANRSPTLPPHRVGISSRSTPRRRARSQPTKIGRSCLARSTLIIIVFAADKKLANGHDGR